MPSVHSVAHRIEWIKEWIHLKVVYKWAADMNYTKMQIN